MVIAAAVTFGGCARKERPYTAKEAVSALEKQASEIKTVRGRAWISAHTPEQKISFPAMVAIDRTDPKRPELRIEGTDPIGATHSLMLLDRAQRFTWVDFDQKRIYRMRSSWHGIPLARLPELVLGISTLPPDGHVTAAGPDGFDVRFGKNTLHYDMTWIDPGPRLALSVLSGTIVHRALAQQYVVGYKKFLDKDDFYLPAEVVLRGYSNARSNPDQPTVEISIAWRERTWNEPIPARAFELPQKAVRGFRSE